MQFSGLLVLDFATTLCQRDRSRQGKSPTGGSFLKCTQLTYDLNVSGRWILARMHFGQHVRFKSDSEYRKILSPDEMMKRQIKICLETTAGSVVRLASI